MGARGPTTRCHTSRELAWRTFAALGPAWVPWGTSGGGCCFHLQDPEPQRQASSPPPRSCLWEHQGQPVVAQHPVHALPQAQQVRTKKSSITVT